MEQKFNGFMQETMHFLLELRFHNHKEWFQENKNRFHEAVKEPFCLFGKETGDGLNQLFKKYQAGVTVTPAVARIHRDIRFSKNKEPYRDHLWVTWKPVGEDWMAKPCFFFDIAPGTYSYGMGFYKAPPAVMENYRKAIQANPAAFFTLLSAFEKQKDFVLEGEKYQKKHAYPENPKIENWYQRKSIAFIAEKEIDEQVLSPALPASILRRFESIFPLYLFLNQVSVI